MSVATEVMNMASALSTDDKWSLVESMLTALKGAPISVSKAKPSKAKKERDPDAPKRAVKPDSFIHLLHKIVSPVLTDMAKTVSDETEKKLLKDVKARSQVAKALWQKISELESEARADAITAFTPEEVNDAFAAWKLDPPAVEYKGKKAAKAAAAAASAAASEETASVASSVSETKTSKPRKPLTDEQKASRKEKAAATKAKKAAEKAAEASMNTEVEKVAAALEAAVEETVDCDPYPWKHNFGHGAITYERIDYEGKAYIYTLDDKTYLGVYVEASNSLDKSVADPTAP
jgi:hypothetical protein